MQAPLSIFPKGALTDHPSNGRALSEGVGLHPTPPMSCSPSLLRYNLSVFVDFDHFNRPLPSMPP